MEYQMTRIGNIVARCLQEPFDTNARDEIKRCIYSVANENPRPIILEDDINKLTHRVMELFEILNVLVKVKKEK